jgi:predicted ATPase
MKLDFKDAKPPFSASWGTVEIPQFTVLVGENGSGKSKLLKAILSLEVTTNLQLGEPAFGVQKYADHWRKQQQQHIVLRDFNNLLNVQTDRIIDDVPLGTSIVADPFRKSLARHTIEYLKEWENNLLQKFRAETYGENRQYRTENDFIKTFGVSPLTEANDLLRKAGLPFVLEIKSRLSPHDQPLDYLRLAEGSLALRKVGPENSQSETFESSELSTGEKVLLALALMKFNYHTENNAVPKLILLDEIDSVLHPNALPDVLKAIDTILIKELGCHVILTTHSPTTVALAPENSLYMLVVDSPGLQRVSQSDAIKQLTKSVPFEIDMSQTRFVICESENDAAAYTSLASHSAILPTPRKKLVFIGAGPPLAQAGGKAAVTEAVKLFEKNGNQSVFGLIDDDGSNEPNPRVKVFGHKQRNGIENAIFDPLLVLALLVRDANQNLEAMGLPSKIGMEDLLKADQATLQSHINIVQTTIFDVQKTDEELRQSYYCLADNSFKLDVRSSWLMMDDHELEKSVTTKLLELAPALRKFTNGANDLEKPKRLRDRILTDVLRHHPSLAPRAFRIAFDELINAES